MLDDEVVRAVAVEIANADAIDASHVLFQLDRAISVERRTVPRGGRDSTLGGSHDAVSAIGDRIRVDEIGRGDEGLRRQLHVRRARPRAIDVEAGAARIGVEEPPAHVHAAAIGSNGDEPAIERLANALGGPPERRARFVERIHRVEVEIRRDLLGRQRPQLAIVALRWTRGGHWWSLLLLLAPKRADARRHDERDDHAGHDDANHGDLETDLYFDLLDPRREQDPRGHDESSSLRENHKESEGTCQSRRSIYS
jgi:hypothetical protein